MKYDYLIVGAGLYGATFAYLAKQKGKRCVVFDKRKHAGGNLYCDFIKGINVHKYGAHIFHTSRKEIWDFVNSLVEFNRFTNSPIACKDGNLYNLPFNMNTFYGIWNVHTPLEAIKKLEEQRLQIKEIIGNREPKNLEEQALLLVGYDIYELLIKDYTEKQWGRKCTELPSSIIKRLPLRMSFDNNYFDDKYQGVPVGGYNRLINALLDGIPVFCNVNFDSNDDWRTLANNLVYTGALDEYFHYSEGHLDWRTLSFVTRQIQIPNYQGNAVVNYTGKGERYTRVIEHKHFEMFGDDVYKHNHTIVTHEYPEEYKQGCERYYPINDQKNDVLAAKYKILALKEKNVIFGGRLADYKYYDMDDVIEKAINESKKL